MMYLFDQTKGCTCTGTNMECSRYGVFWVFGLALEKGKLIKNVAMETVSDSTFASTTEYLLISFEVGLERLQGFILTTLFHDSAMVVRGSNLSSTGRLFMWLTSRTWAVKVPSPLRNVTLRNS